MSTQANDILAAGMKHITDTATTIILPIVAALIFAAIVRIAVFVYMKNKGYQRATADLASYLAFATTLFGLYLIWGRYVIGLAKMH